LRDDATTGAQTLLFKLEPGASIPSTTTRRARTSTARLRAAGIESLEERLRGARRDLAWLDWLSSHGRARRGENVL